MLGFVSNAMFPRMENVTTPATRHVIVFTIQVIIASLNSSIKIVNFTSVLIQGKYYWGNTLLVTVVVEFVVGPQSRKSTSSDTVSEEDLCCSVNLLCHNEHNS